MRLGWEVHDASRLRSSSKTKAPGLETPVTCSCLSLLLKSGGSAESDPRSDDGSPGVRTRVDKRSASAPPVRRSIFVRPHDGASRRQIAESHGGTLLLENRRDLRGARARLEFPMGEDGKAIATRQRVAHHDRPASSPRASPAADDPARSTRRATARYSQPAPARIDVGDPELVGTFGREVPAHQVRRGSGAGIPLRRARPDLRVTPSMPRSRIRRPPRLRLRCSRACLEHHDGAAAPAPRADAAASPCGERRPGQGGGISLHRRGSISNSPDAQPGRGFPCTRANTALAFFPPWKWKGVHPVAFDG